MAYILCCMLLLKFEDPIAHYLETRHFLWDSPYVLCSAMTSLIAPVSSQSANRQNKN